jgi:hypothetical protein
MHQGLKAAGLGEISFRLLKMAPRKNARASTGDFVALLTTSPAGRCRVDGSIEFYSAQPISNATRFEYTLDRLPPPTFAAYGLQSIIQHIAHFP